jgi:hypothetical protein
MANLDLAAPSAVILPKLRLFLKSSSLFVNHVGLWEIKEAGMKPTRLGVIGLGLILGAGTPTQS